MVCRDICKRYRFVSSNKSSRQIYLDGAVRCNSFCQIFLRWDGAFCPCCGMKLRRKPRNKQGKAMMQKIDSKRSEANLELEPFIKVVR